MIRLEEPCLKHDCSHETPCGLHGGLLSEVSYHIMDEYFLTEFETWRFDGIWDINVDITEEIDWVVQDFDDPETILNTVIPVIIIKLNYIKQLQNLKESDAWHLYKQPCSSRNCSADTLCPVHNHSLLQDYLRSKDPRNLVVINYLKCLKERRKNQFWCFMLGTVPHSGQDSAVWNICGLRPVIDLIHFYTTNIFDGDVEKDMETVQEQLAALIAERKVKRLFDEIMMDNEEADWVGKLKMDHSLSFGLLKSDFLHLLNC